MKRPIVLLAGLLALPLAARGDTVVLVDGRTFTGTVQVDGTTVAVQLPQESVRFPKNQVARIELKAKLEAELAGKLQAAPKDDPAALLAIANWASSNELKPRAAELYDQVLKLDPNHAEARRALGHVQIAGAWMTFDKAMELARGKLDANEQETLAKTILPAMEAAASPPQLLLVKELAGLAQLRAGDFSAAMRTFATLAEGSTGMTALRYDTMVSILKSNPDGMYVVTEAYPPASGLFAKADGALKPGPASLTQPAVFQAALRDRAKKFTEAGRKDMEAGAKLDETDTDGAAARYAEAGKSFDKADALVADISRSYRIEIIRRRITVLRKDADVDAGRFDKDIADLGKTSATPQQYRGMVLRLLHNLDGVREDLQNILQLARPYQKDLILEITLTETNLKKVESMRKILTDELDGQK